MKLTSYVALCQLHYANRKNDVIIIINYYLNLYDARLLETLGSLQNVKNIQNRATKMAEKTNQDGNKKRKRTDNFRQISC